MVGVAHAKGQIRQVRLNIWIELKFWVDGIIVSDLDLGNPQHDAPALDILHFLQARPGRRIKTLSLSAWGGENLHSSNRRSHLH